MGYIYYICLLYIFNDTVSSQGYIVSDEIKRLSCMMNWEGLRRK